MMVMMLLLRILVVIVVMCGDAMVMVGEWRW